MEHAICRVVDFRIVDTYSIDVSFEDGVTRRIDLEPVLEGELYRPLREAAMFRRVCLDPEIGTLIWPNGADFDPATLHDWPKAAEGFIAMARGWKPARREGTQPEVVKER
uniref:DUF2442 domain-containing protein n=1 Tax=Candidatus Kentrum sp. FM TaxID=2126340 RepID=A0A450SRF7_9GAMM|nr:MAG: Protein of unknown function (DUF2442) [Candidatus Kentron sp. FM]VFJ56769.1 MAG: Protein of unknown function (DUF2442) [Candidatus Kentron sp. FM]VFK11541.1 MAG: Protein of unknown function (DUF2442) [Candidatus Kentron sp. FM]